MRHTPHSWKGTRMSAIRVAAISDSQSFLADVKSSFATDPGFDLVWSCPREGLGWLVDVVRPDVMLVDGRVEHPLDLCLPRGAGTRPSVILLADEAEEFAEFGDLWKIAALEAGARGVLGRESMARDLVDAVKAVQGGELWGPREVVALVRDRPVQPFEPAEPDEALGLARPYAYN